MNVDGVVVTSEYNRRYMTNFTGSAGVVIISEDKAAFVTDFRYVEQATSQTEGFDIVQHKGPIVEEVASVVKQFGIKSLVLNRIMLHMDSINYLISISERNLFQSRTQSKTYA